MKKKRGEDLIDKLAFGGMPTMGKPVLPNDKRLGLSKQQGYSEGGQVDKWMQGVHPKKGALHEQLGIPQGQKISTRTLEKATHSPNALLDKRANLALRYRGKAAGGSVVNRLAMGGPGAPMGMPQRNLQGPGAAGPSPMAPTPAAPSSMYAGMPTGRSMARQNDTEMRGMAQQNPSGFKSAMDSERNRIAQERIASTNAASQRRGEETKADAFKSQAEQGAKLGSYWNPESGSFEGHEDSLGDQFRANPIGKFVSDLPGIGHAFNSALGTADSTGQFIKNPSVEGAMNVAGNAGDFATSARDIMADPKAALQQAGEGAAGKVAGMFKKGGHVSCSNPFYINTATASKALHPKNRKR